MGGAWGKHRVHIGTWASSSVVVPAPRPRGVTTACGKRLKAIGCLDKSTDLQLRDAASLRWPDRKRIPGKNTPSSLSSFLVRLAKNPPWLDPKGSKGDWDSFDPYKSVLWGKEQWEERESGSGEKNKKYPTQGSTRLFIVRRWGRAHTSYKRWERFSRGCGMSEQWLMNQEPWQDGPVLFCQNNCKLRMVKLPYSLKL